MVQVQSFICHHRANAVKFYQQLIYNRNKEQPYQNQLNDNVKQEEF